MNTATTNKTKKLPRKIAKVKSQKNIVDKELRKVPNLFFLGLAGAAVVSSALLSLSHGGKKKILGHFIGLWVPSLLTLSLYNKVNQVEDEVLDVTKH